MFDPNDALTTREAAQRLGVSLRTIQIWVEAGTLPAWKTPGGHRRIPRDAVEDLLAKAPKSRKAQPQQVTLSRPLDVLIVEDDPVQRRLLQTILIEFLKDVTLRIAQDGYEGLLRAGQRVPDVIVSDIMMAGMDGLQMLRLMAGMPEFRHTSMIAISALSPADIVERGGLPDNVAYLGKPLDRAALLNVMESLGAVRQALANTQS